MIPKEIAHSQPPALSSAYEFANHWDRLESRYRDTNYEGVGRSDSVRFSARNSYMVLTAPHSLSHWRDSSIKLADRWTGGLCDLLSVEFELTAVTCTGPIGVWDVWSERTDDFKETLDSLLHSERMVVDIHGMQDRHGIDVCVGLGPHPSEEGMRAASTLSEELVGYRVRINDPFAATKDYTVASYVQNLRCGSGAVQLEIAAGLRNPAEFPERAGQFALDLGRALSAVKRG